MATSILWPNAQREDSARLCGPVDAYGDAYGIRGAFAARQRSDTEKSESFTVSVAVIVHRSAMLAWIQHPFPLSRPANVQTTRASPATQEVRSQQSEVKVLEDLTLRVARASPKPSAEWASASVKPGLPAPEARLVSENMRKALVISSLRTIRFPPRNREARLTSDLRPLTSSSDHQ